MSPRPLIVSQKLLHHRMTAQEYLLHSGVPTPNPYGTLWPNDLKNNSRKNTVSGELKIKDMLMLDHSSTYYRCGRKRYKDAKIRGGGRHRHYVRSYLTAFQD